MSVSVENTSALGRKIEATIPNQQLQTLLNNKITKLSKEVKLKGFRPGKVPPQVIQKQFGPSVRQEVIAELIEETLRNTLEKNELQPAGQPVVESINDKDQEDLRFTVSFEIFPVIELADLSQKEIKRKVAEISEDEVDQMQQKLCKNLGDWVAVDRAAQEGDRVKINFVRTLEGQDAEDSKTDVVVELGGELTLPGLSDQIIGHKSGEQVDADIHYPQTWGESLAAGKKAVLQITIQEIQENQPLSPETLAERLGLKEKTREALLEKIKERMLEEANRKLFQEFQESVLELLLENNHFELPASLIEQEKQAIYKEQERNKKSGRPQSPVDENEVNDTALKRVKLGLLINEVIKKFNLKADGKLLRKEVEYIAQEFPNPEEIVNIYFSNKQLLSGVERVVLLQQSVEALRQHLNVVDEAVTFDEVMNPNK